MAHDLHSFFLTSLTSPAQQRGTKEKNNNGSQARSGKELLKRLKRSVGLHSSASRQRSRHRRT